MSKRKGLTACGCTFLGLAVIFGLIQLIPYGHNHSNPPVVSQPKWDSPQTLDLAKRACFDCHSNETVWPWYSNIAPVSWLVQYDVDGGRRRLNFSTWGVPSANPGGRRQRSPTGEIAETIIEGSMPPIQYTIQHPEARLTQPEKGLLIQGFQSSLGNSSGFQFYLDKMLAFK